MPMRFPPSFLEELKTRLPVSEVVGRKVKLTKAGREWRGLSPFTSEKTPSFFVNDQKMAWFDFSSGRTGNIFDFVMATEGFTFPEAVERLAADANLPLPAATSAEQQQSVSESQKSPVDSQTATTAENPINDDLLVGVFCSLVAIPLCEASWQAIVTEKETLRGIAGLVFGLPIGALGFTFHWWKNKWKGRLQKVADAAVYWWPIAIVLIFAYVAGPEIYRRASQPLSPQTHGETTVTRGTPDSGIIARLQVQLTAVQQERDSLKQVIVKLQAQPKENESALAIARQEVATLKNRIEEMRQSKLSPSPLLSAPNNEDGPITWENRLFLSQGQATSTVAFAVLRGTNTSSSAVQMKDAYFLSDLTGEKLPLLINIPYGTLGGEKVPIAQTNPVPPGAKIQLVVEWKPAISVRDFIDQWGKIDLIMHYDTTNFRRLFDEAYMKNVLLQDIVGADLVLGVPRVTKKDSNK